MGLFSALFGTYSDRQIKKIIPIVNKIEELSDMYANKTDEELFQKTAEFKSRLASGETLDDILPEAYATVREASWRVLGKRPFRVQLMCGILLHQGRVAEMKTGEGKTLVAVMPSYLNALTGNGVHVVTVNDYLARLGCEEMGRVHEFLGLTTGLVVHGQTREEKKKAYNSDITYGTNNEFGFDYLRDNMVIYKKDMAQRGHNFAIVDEVDSILIDEARTPLIISGAGRKSTDLYDRADAFVSKLSKFVVKELDMKVEHDDVTQDYILDEKAKTTTLTKHGVRKAEEFFEIENLTAPENSELYHHIQQALKARGIMQRDTDYVIKDGQVVIVDTFTGRLMPGRRYSDGLHQAIEAKEKVKIQRENRTIATITFQNYFRMYKKLSGMTGTALSEDMEFREIYNLDVVEVPTNMPMIRKDYNDRVYKTIAGKDRAVINQIKECHEKGQPVLVGTVSIEKSEALSRKLKGAGIPHTVLNAKYHEKEAEIVAQAGKFGAVTISTNMAGRGTDIMLGGNAEYLAKQKMRRDGYDEATIALATGSSQSVSDEVLEARRVFKELYESFKIEIEPEANKVREVGGLFIIGTERHESRRIDNQLRGRSGRQGDPGDSKFFLALDDDLMRIFGAARLQGMLTTLGLKTGEAITHPWITKALEKAQKRVEARYFEARKELLKYDDVMNEQRTVIYKQRDDLMVSEDLSPLAREMIGDVVEIICENSIPEKAMPADWNLTAIHNAMMRAFALDITDIEKWKTDEEITERKAYESLLGLALRRYEQQATKYGPELMQMASRQMMLGALDSVWKKHLQQMDYLQSAIGLRGYAQKNPLYEYKREALELFKNTINNFKIMSVSYICRMELTREDVAATEAERAKHDEKLNQATGDSRRNAPCPCGSGLKYKHCCGKLN